MTDNFRGADVDALRRLAQQMEGAQRSLSDGSSSVRSRLAEVSWIGPDVERFRSEELSRYLTASSAAAQVLAKVVRDLRFHADEQERTSALSADDLLGGIGSDARLDQAIRESEAERWLEAEGLRQAWAASDNLTPAQQLAWWNSLTPEQRAALIEHHPGLVSGLDGLPADVREAAQERYDESIRSKIVRSETSIEIDADVNIPAEIPIWVGVGVEGTYRRLDDGSIELRGHGEEFVGLFGGEGSAEINGGVGVDGEMTLTFKNDREFHRFLDDVARLQDKVLDAPGHVGGNALKGGLVGGLVGGPVGAIGGAIIGGGSTAASDAIDISGDLSDLAEKYGHNVTSAKVGIGGKLAAGFDAGPIGKLDADVKAMTRFDVVTKEAEWSVERTLDGSLFGAHGSVDLGFTVSAPIDDPFHPTLVIDGSGRGGLDVLRMAGIPTDNATLERNLGEVRFTATIDLADPAFADKAIEVMNDLQHGRLGAGSTDLVQLMDRASIEVQAGLDVGGAKGGFDAVVVSGSVETSGVVFLKNYVKAPGGPFHEYGG